MDIKRNFMLFVLFICSTLKTNLSHGADSISANLSLSGDQTIVSAGGVFELGFFKPGNSSKFYIGIWYKKVSLQTTVWVANRETPISDRYSSKLKILNGNLVLLNESQVPIWSTNLNFTTSNSIQAVLHDTGNLVLRDGSNSSELLWQSFDYPAHTWLPGNKIGLNKRTKTIQRITSWKSSEDPAPGLFTIEIDPNGTSQFFMLWNGSEIFWTSGPWIGQTFSNLPEMALIPFYNISYVSNKNENSLAYYVIDSNFALSRTVMDVSGHLKQLRWLDSTKQWHLFWSQPNEQCEVYAVCGMFGSCNEKSMPFCKCLMGFEPKLKNDWNSGDYSGGCVRKTPLQCGNYNAANGERDGFFVNSNMRLPDHPQVLATESAKKCESTCLNNCSCTAYGYESNGCSIWFGDLLNLQQLSEGDSSGKTLYIRLAASEFPSPKKNTVMVIGIVVASIAVVVALLVLIEFLRRRRSFRTGKAVEGSLLSFGYRDLQHATKNFSVKLGGGGFGSVFKGTLPNSTAIAVKKLESISQGEKQFRTEVSTIGTIQHVNLVRLRGFCSEGTKKLLVYDYMPNGSLDATLFHEKDSKTLDWKTRYQIALGTARGLFYLHEKCRDCIIHCDIKPENILLDAEFCPKVADFGLAKLIGREFSRVLTTMRGTRGYLAPEWISGVAITTKADVYSYGMMLLELVSGRRNSEQSADEKVKFFPTFAAIKIAEGEDIFELLDYRLERNADLVELTRICRVACWCIQDDETHRPSMGHVVQILEGFSDVNLPLVPRSLQLLVDNHENIIFFTESSSSQSSQAQTNLSAASSQTKSITSSTSFKS